MPFLSVKAHPARLALYHCIMRGAYTEWSARSLSGWRWLSGYTASFSSCYIMLHVSHLFNRPVSSLPDLLAMFAVTMTTNSVTISVSMSILQTIPQKPFLLCDQFNIKAVGTWCSRWKGLLLFTPCLEKVLKVDFISTPQTLVASQRAFSDDLCPPWCLVSHTDCPPSWYAWLDL